MKHSLNGMAIARNTESGVYDRHNTRTLICSTIWDHIFIKTALIKLRRV